MAWANYDHRTWYPENRNKEHELADYIHGFQTLNNNDIHMLKRYLNGSRWVLFWGNKKYINIIADASINYGTKMPSNTIGAKINIKDNTLTVYDLELLQSGANVFCYSFSGSVTVRYHWGTNVLYQGTKHEIPSAEPCSELDSKHKEDIYAWSGMKFDLETYKVINKPPKEVKEKLNRWKEITRIQKNASARARRANLRAFKRLDIYRNTGNINDIEMEDAFRLFNVSERREVIDAFGMDTILANCESEVLDKDTVDDRPYEVVRVKVEDKTMPDGSRWCNYLRMVNPSTSEIHFEGVPNTQNTVQNALMWRDGDKETYVKPIVLT
tara:strand:+ start:14030 stop:15007 length:978 start_codon:yes stop_codon:yes gene_type:complete